MELTHEKQLALIEVRKAMYERLKNFCLTEEMLQNHSPYQMLCLLELLLGHRNYIGMFSHTCWSLEEIFGDVIWEKPKQPEPEPKQEPVRVN